MLSAQAGGVSDAAVGDAPSDTASSPMSCGHDQAAAVEPGRRAVLDSADLVGVLQEAREQPAGRPVGARRPGRPAVHAPTPNLLRLTDITEQRTAEGKIYFCAIKDVYAGNVGYSIDSRMKASLAVSALRSAITRRGPAGTVVHSDGDSQVRSNAFVRTPKNNGLIGSTGGSAPAATTPRWDPSTPCCRRTCSTGNAGNTRAPLRLAIITWTEKACRRRRRRRLTPVGNETLTSAAAAV
jgi:transposase InsO family protein